MFTSKERSFITLQNLERDDYSGLYLAQQQCLVLIVNIPTARSGAEPGVSLGSFQGPILGYFGVFWDVTSSE
jgi:hypothetical protein